jgi:hypothetical protein
MAAEPALVSFVTGPLSSSTCDLCGQTRVPQGTVVIQFVSGAMVRLAACEPCVRALRRVSAATGGHAHFALGAPAARGALREAPEDSSPSIARTALIREYAVGVVDADGTRYKARAYGQERTDGTWMGWLEFEPEAPNRPVRLTGQETSQPDREALTYWASGLEPVYLEGALTRADLIMRRSPASQSRAWDVA